MTSQCKHYACFASKFVGGCGDGMAGGLKRASSFVYPSAAAEERERKRAKKKKIGASTAAAAEEEEGTLESPVWSRLPEDLLDKVVQYLPIPALVRARAVCKRLRDFIFSDRFQEASCCVPTWSSLSTETPYLLVFVTIKGHRMCSAYDSIADRWRRMPPLPGLPCRAKDCIAGPSAPNLSPSAKPHPQTLARSCSLPWDFLWYFLAHWNVSGMNECWNKCNRRASSSSSSQWNWVQFPCLFLSLFCNRGWGTVMFQRCGWARTSNFVCVQSTDTEAQGATNNVDWQLDDTTRMDTDTHGDG